MLRSLSGPWALLPIALFLILFIGSGVYFTLQGTEYAFYKVSPAVAILPAVILGILMGHNTICTNINHFIEGVRDRNIITMCLIYLLAGAYTSILQGIGGVEATVNLALSVIPPSLTVPGVFMIAAFVSTAMGTSMGTIVAVAPIAIGMSQATGIDPALMMGGVIGGAMFGDNLSMISDTTIAATQIHGCSLVDKFKFNGLIALPAMIATVVTLFYLGMGLEGHEPPTETINLWLTLPYFFVLVLALAGVNVFTTLMLGIIVASFTGLVFGAQVASLTSFIYSGYTSMTEILILSLLIGGVSHLAKEQGGIRFLITLTDGFVKRYAKKTEGSRVAEGAISIIVSFCDICTANNTIAIILSGEATHEIAKKYKVSPVKAATFVGLFSCVFQGLLPYSAQVLLAGSLAGLSPLAIIPHIHYCVFLGIAGVAAIVFRWPKSYH